MSQYACEIEQGISHPLETKESMTPYNFPNHFVMKFVPLI